ncbi:MAG: hypothetical protein OEN01_12695, partial [Candidatus Krumholzibacteria bacterium]|nr:hypothetical protein [Candidatus Krumholzibacteria bacterium]
MHKASRLLLLVSCALLLCSCASGLSPREYGSTDYADLLYELYREEPESTEPKLLSMPVKLGVAQIGEVAPHQATLAELRKHPQVISNVIELPLPGGRRSRRNQEPVPQLRTDALRRLGRELGADYVFLFGGS